MGILEAGIMGLTTVVMVMAYVLIVPFGVMYVLEELRGWRSGGRDPNLGARVVTALLLSVCAQVALGGLAALIAGFVEEQLGGELVRKNALALVFGGIAAAALPLVMVRRLAEDRRGTITRQALGINALVAGAVTTFAIFATSLAFFNDGKIAALVVVALTYGGATMGFLRPLLAARPAEPG